ncbi:Uncharacterized protein Fot_32875 [Forsythia ovata]|uniref:Uncharacterized protein n=1 Tax=Forsythia ovata TaxID=205694 RepID=A0ABD1T9K4_9LAMI
MAKSESSLSCNTKTCSELFENCQLLPLSLIKKRSNNTTFHVSLRTFQKRKSKILAEDQINGTSSLHVPDVQIVFDDNQPADRHDVSDIQNEPVTNEDHIIKFSSDVYTEDKRHFIQIIHLINIPVILDDRIVFTEDDFQVIDQTVDNVEPSTNTLLTSVGIFQSDLLPMGSV